MSRSPNIYVVRVLEAAGGGDTPHDGRYVVRWNPHTLAGTLSLTSTANVAIARRFTREEAFAEWKAISRLQPTRPWDGKPNRPLSGVTIEIIPVEIAFV